MSCSSVRHVSQRAQLSLLPLLIVLLLLPALAVLAEGPAAPALGFTPTPTSLPPTAAPSATPGPDATPTPESQPEQADPVITKRGDPAQALPGEKVTFTIQVTNPGKQAAVDVVVVDTLPEHLEILEVTATQGTVTIEGQVVTVQVGVVGSGFMVEIVIHTRVRADAPAPLDLENVAYLHSPNGGDCSSSPVTVTVTNTLLPVTGGTRHSMEPAVVGVCVAATLIIALWGAWVNSRPENQG